MTVHYLVLKKSRPDIRRLDDVAFQPSPSSSCGRVRRVAVNVSTSLSIHRRHCLDVSIHPSSSLSWRRVSTVVVTVLSCYRDGPGYRHHRHPIVALLTSSFWRRASSSLLPPPSWRHASDVTRLGRLPASRYCSHPDDRSDAAASSTSRRHLVVIVPSAVDCPPTWRQRPSSDAFMTYDIIALETNCARI